jgi:hypothetical protein
MIWSCQAAGFGRAGWGAPRARAGGGGGAIAARRGDPGRRGCGVGPAGGSGGGSNGAAGGGAAGGGAVWGGEVGVRRPGPPAAGPGSAGVRSGAAGWPVAAGVDRRGAAGRGGAAPWLRPGGPASPARQPMMLCRQPMIWPMIQSASRSPPAPAATASLSDCTIAANRSAAGGGAWVTRHSYHR